MEDRVVDMLFFGEVSLEKLFLFEILFLGDDILDMERLRAKYSADFLVCERAR